MNEKPNVIPGDDIPFGVDDLAPSNLPATIPQGGALLNTEQQWALAQTLQKGGVFCGMEEMDQGDIQVPRLKIVQLTCKDANCTYGTYRDSLSGAEFESVTFAMLRMDKNRVLWPPAGQGDKPICKSTNGMVPDADFPNPPSRVCAKKAHKKARPMAVCPRAQWGGNGEAPDCHLVYSLLGIDVNEGTPFMISFAGTAISPVKKMLSFLAMRTQRFQVPPFAFTMRMSTFKDKNDKGTFYVPTFDDFTLLEEEPLRYYPQYQALADVDLSVSAGETDDDEPTASDDAPYAPQAAAPQGRTYDDEPPMPNDDDAPGPLPGQATLFEGSAGAPPPGYDPSRFKNGTAKAGKGKGK